MSSLHTASSLKWATRIYNGSCYSDFKARFDFESQEIRLTSLQIIRTTLHSSWLRKSKAKCSRKDETIDMARTRAIHLYEIESEDATCLGKTLWWADLVAFKCHFQLQLLQTWQRSHLLLSWCDSSLKSHIGTWLFWIAWTRSSWYLATFAMLRAIPKFRRLFRALWICSVCASALGSVDQWSFNSQALSKGTKHWLSLFLLLFTLQAINASAASESKFSTCFRTYLAVCGPCSGARAGIGAEIRRGVKASGLFWWCYQVTLARYSYWKVVKYESKVPRCPTEFLGIDMLRTSKGIDIALTFCVNVNSWFG